MSENFDFLDSPEWRVAWAKPAAPDTAIGAIGHHSLLDGGDDFVLEQLVMPDGGDAGNALDATSGSGDGCMNMAVLLNTEALEEFASPMPPPPPATATTNLPSTSAAFPAKRKAAICVTPVRAPEAQSQPKRRQIIADSPGVDRRWDDDCDANADDYFRTQFIKLCDGLAGTDHASQPAAAQLDGLSQFFGAFSSQFDAANPTQQPPPPTAAAVTALQIARPLSDDVASVRFDEDIVRTPTESAAATRLDDTDLPAIATSQLLSPSPSPAPSTQTFLRAMAQVQAVAAPLVQAPSTVEPVAIYTNAAQATAYIEMQRAMSERNEENVGDADFLDPELSQAYRSTQYRREVAAVFDDCERSIGARRLEPDIGVDSGGGVDDSAEEEAMAAAAAAAAPTSDTHSLEGFNWTQNDFGRTPIAKASVAEGATTRTPLITTSVFVRRRLDELNRLPSPKSATTNGADIKRATPAKTSTGFTGLGPFYGLPLRVKTLIRDYKGIGELYDWQKQCLSLPAIGRRNNLIYALPTSGGKTLVSEILILREILCRRRNCLFILPYVSIVQEKMWSLSPFAVELDFLLEEYAAGKGALPPLQRRKKRSIYIATIEKGLALLDSLIEAGRANELGLIVVDELHIIGEPGRGARLETLLAKAMHIEAGIQIVGMSATIGNMAELATFLRADVFTRDFRPVELREYIKCGGDLMQINPAADGAASKSFDYVRSVEFNYRPDVLRRDPDHLAGLVSEVIPEQACLVFCPTKQNCENVALLLCRLLPKKYSDYKAAQRAELRNFLETDGGPLCQTLTRTLPYGIAYHHSGLTGEERRHLEDAFRQNILCVLCCTSTLAAGVNLPAKRVILRSPYVGREFITLSRYKQMVGRAGRAGLCGDVGESILICAQRDNERVGRLLCAPMDEAVSSLHADGGQGVQALLLSAIGLRMAETRAELEALMRGTLLSVQATRLGIDMCQLTSTVLANLFRMQTVRLAEDTQPIGATGASMTTTTTLTSMAVATDSSQLFDDSSSAESPSDAGGPLTASAADAVRNIRVKPSSRMLINSLGRASFKSGFSVSKARTVYRDLRQAQRSLVLSSFLHLLYVVTPYEAHEANVRPRADVYYAQYARLGKHEQHVARTLGIGEPVAQRIRAEKPIQPAPLQRIVGRFFMTLMLNQLWHQRTVHEVADAFAVNRGVVQALVVAAASYASGVLRCCEEMDQFWAMRELLRTLTKRLSYCCTAELVPLMDLPCVKLVRAKQLYAAGFKSLEHVAKAEVRQLTDAVQHLNARIAKQLIASAKVLLLEKVESLREEVQDCLEVLEGRTV